ncbi:MAG: hypothetical protein N3G20_05400, partial [Verrucomicrobiae bacterium]|nr:hypothetical protein [Verrucomicrobiae bacterium]
MSPAGRDPVWMSPFGLIELVCQRFDFNQCFALGVEMASGVPAEVFRLDCSSPRAGWLSGSEAAAPEDTS